MVYKITLSLSGDNIDMDAISNSVGNNIYICSQQKTGEKINFELPKMNSYNLYASIDHIQIWHINKFSTENNIYDYEKSFVNYLINNSQMIKKSGVETIHLYYEIFFDGGQCNFAILTNTQIKKLVKLNVSYPVSTYVLKKQKLKQWKKEINLVWKDII